MIKFLKEQKALLLFVALLFTFHWFSKDISNPYQRPISGDAQAYYAYLPALFIYNDLDYKFIETDAKQHYAPGYIKDFIKDVDGEKVNKTFPGVAVLYAPFFFTAHINALILGKPADGFSTVYQFWFDVGIWFYFLLGLIFLRKLLVLLHFSPKNALFSTILIGFGTNMLFYTVYDQSVTHIHNFFMINGMLSSLILWEKQKRLRWIIIALVLLALIGITRPTNFVVFGLILFFFGKKQFFLDVFRSIFSKKGFKIIPFVVPVLALPFILWKLQTGHWVVYSYGEEGFDFTKPHFFEFLFSYTKGWLLYTPIVVPILLLGLTLLFRSNKRQFSTAILFYGVAIYIFSSWWCWYYGAGMSQRVMIDHYVLLAFLLATCLKFLEEKPLLKRGFMGLLVILATFNVAQAYQIANGILGNGSPTKEGYWDNFLVMEKRARVYPQEHWQFIEEKELAPPSFTTQVGVNAEFSASVEETIEPLVNGSKLILSFESKAHTEIVETRAVLLLKPYFQEEEQHVFYLKEFAKKDEWVLTEFLIEPVRDYSDSLKLYFWNAKSDEHVEFRNFRIRQFYSDEYF